MHLMQIAPIIQIMHILQCRIQLNANNPTHIVRDAKWAEKQLQERQPHLSHVETSTLVDGHSQRPATRMYIFVYIYVHIFVSHSKRWLTVSSYPQSATYVAKYSYINVFTNLRYLYYFEFLRSDIEFCIHLGPETSPTQSEERY